MIKTSKYSSGEVRYCDCLDEEYGLPSLETNSIELGYFDPPWNSNLKKTKRTYLKTRTLDNSKKTHFNDVVSDEWNLEWFNQAERVCKKIILVISETQKFWWIRNTNPVADVPVLWKNGFSSSKVAKFSRKSSYLFYGKFERHKKLMYDVIAKRYDRILVPFTFEWGSLNPDKFYNHPSPKGIKICMSILKQLKPESLIDCFAGSGSFIYAAHLLGIKWIGYEINDKEYKQDIERRFSQSQLNENQIMKWIK